VPASRATGPAEGTADDLAGGEQGDCCMPGESSDRRWRVDLLPKFQLDAGPERRILVCSDDGGDRWRMPSRPGRGAIALSVEG